MKNSLELEFLFMNLNKGLRKSRHDKKANYILIYWSVSQNPLTKTRNSWYIL